MNEHLLQRPASLAPLVLEDFRVAFLTASTWASCTATDTDLVLALAAWAPGQLVSDAVAALQLRRRMERRGLRQRQEREARIARGEDPDPPARRREEKKRPGANTVNTNHTKGNWDL